ncbi:PREDICTED: putative F-box/kelch-repeat protein At2g29780 [Camelina sativa]|uniref:F-box/kelch-repeat protein At2g29780 n=1 Tax=Camelina sativa TaxID=90675 RepID=A0ABM0WP44_CAMSA|nr:PREDICTED: putative F-box/kelch-repeat protein At2g29780 [Camelina sativa]XP_010473973.1 PREDICTED: putative F-box/kelch-repeat protein At2g29780 [Camelina sativa]
MALISETTDDGSNGGDPSKNPQQVENQNENPKEEDQNLAPVTLYIPEGLAESILLLVERCNYPKVSLFSRFFHHVISSPELYQRRSQLGLTEPVLYASIRFHLNILPSWFILNRNVPRKISLRLTELRSLPPLKPGAAMVTIGYEMYVIGGCDESYDRPTSDVLVIDCRFHKCRLLPGMQRARNSAAAGAIDRKIYVIGGCEQRDDNWIEVFDVETGIWSSVAGPYDHNSSMEEGAFLSYVVMEEKIYMLDPECCFYEPRQGTWQSWGPASPLLRYWDQSSCVVEDSLYSIDSCSVSVYDPNELYWRPLSGVSGLPSLNYYYCKMANVGGNLVILGNTCNRYGFKDVWCIEIALKRLEGGKIRGKVVSRSHVLRSMTSPSIDLFRSVTF